MIAPRLARRFQYKLAIISALAFCLTAWVLLAHKRPPRQSLDEEALRRGFPLVYKHIHSFRGKGGGERQSTTTDYFLHLKFKGKYRALTLTRSMVHSPRMDEERPNPTANHHRGCTHSFPSSSIASRASYPLFKYPVNRSSKMEYSAAKRHRRKNRLFC